MLRSLLSCVMLCVLLTGCNWFEPQVVERPVPVVVHVPDYLRSCPAIPLAGVTDETDQGDVALYVTQLHAVAMECRTKLTTVDGILTQHADQTAPE